MQAQAILPRYYELAVLGLVGSGFLALAGSEYLDWPTVALTAAGLLLRLLSTCGWLKFQIPARAITWATLLYIGFFGVDYLWISREFLPATVHLVCFLAVVKILTTRTRRDYFFLKIIALLELLAASILSANANFFVFLGLFLVFAVAVFASGEVRRGSERKTVVVRAGQRRMALRLSGLMTVVIAGILILGAGLFFFLPRTARAAFQHLISERYHIAGFSNEVTLGQIGEIKRRDTPVMHVRFFGATPSIELKWRGAALSQFDGRRWFNPSQPGQVLRAERGLIRLADNPQRWRTGRRISYEVSLRSISADTLFFAGTPEFLQIPASYVIRTGFDSYRTGFGVQDGLRYGVYSFLETAASGVPDILLTEDGRREYLRLPPLDPRVIALAHQWKTPEAMERHFRDDFRYTLDLPDTEPGDPIAHFLFERREGHCEYFASAMAVMLRSTGIPARVVTGFQGGELNPVSGWQVIRASDAHSWVEAWVEGRGWTTFDPTPADPAARAGNPLLKRLAQYLDAADTFWRDWVLNYNLDQQLTLAARVESNGRGWSMAWISQVGSTARESASYAPWIVGAGALGFAIWRWRPALRRGTRKQAARNEAALAYQRLMADLRHRGFERPDWMTPREFVVSLPAPLAGIVAPATDAYNDWRFGGDTAAANRLSALIRQLPERWPPAPRP